jgi:catechol 2,3-dioxygenase-like lactoylglutathione lyase family enzyme
MNDHEASRTPPGGKHRISRPNWAMAGSISLLLMLSGTARAQSMPAPPNFSFVAIEVPDLERAKKFYVDAIGMKQALILSKAGDAEQKIALNFTGNPRSGGPLLILIHWEKTQDPARNRSSGAIIGFMIADAHGAAVRARTLGYQVVREPSEDATAPMLKTVLRDPDGVTVELTEMRGEVRP